MPEASTDPNDSRDGSALLIAQTQDVNSELKRLEGNIARRVKSSGLWTRWWQTFVAVGTAVSAGLAGYVSHDSVSPEWRMLISIVIAVAGVLANVGNIWKFEARAEEFRRRLRECKQI